MRVSFQGPGRPDKGRHTQFTIRVSAFLALTLLDELLKENEGKQTKKVSCNDLLNTLLTEALQHRGISLEEMDLSPNEKEKRTLEKREPSSEQKTNPSPLWKASEDAIKKAVGIENFQTWLAPLEVLELSKNTLKLLCPDPFSQETLKDGFKPLLENILTKQAKQKVTVYIDFRKASSLTPSVPIEALAPKTPPPKQTDTQELIHRLERARIAAGGFLAYQAQNTICEAFLREMREKKGSKPKKVSKAEFVSCLREALSRLPGKSGAD